MRKLLSGLIIAVMALGGINVFAEQQYQNNGSNIGIALKTNVKGCTATRAGAIVLIDCTAVTGPITITGNITVSGNETVTGTTTHTGATTFNGAATFNSNLTGVNWNEFPGGVGGANWQAAGFNQGINWQAVPQGYTSGINWTGADILGNGLNWTDIRAYGTKTGGDHSGINWQSFGV